MATIMRPGSRHDLQPEVAQRLAHHRGVFLRRGRHVVAAAIGHAEAAAHVEMLDGVAGARAGPRQLAHQAEGIAERLQIGDLAADVHVDAGDRDARQLARPWRRARGASSNGTPNLFSALPVEILACVLASTSGLTRSAMRAVRPMPAATSLSASSSGSTLDVEAEDALAQRIGHLLARLADAGEDDLVRRHAGRARAAQLALRDHVHAGAEPGQRGITAWLELALTA